MIVLNIFLLFFTTLLLSIVGNFFIKKNFVYNFLFGWIFVSIIICLTSYFIPNMTRLIIFFIIFITYLAKRIEQNNYLNSIKISFKKIFSQYLIFFIFSYILVFFLPLLLII